MELQYEHRQRPTTGRILLLNNHEEKPYLQNNHAHCKLNIFTKAPIVGKVKTRIATGIGASRAARLHRNLVRHCLSRTLGFQQQTPTELWCAPNCQHAFFQQIQTQFVDISLRSQVGTDLGQRMAYAMHHSLRQFNSVLLIGTDCPRIDTRYLKRAHQQLRQLDAVLGPAKDGGYVLIGLRRFDPSLFSDVPWGSTEVLDVTRHKLAHLGWNWQELPVLTDIDHPEDLDHARNALNLNSETELWA